MHSVAATPRISAIVITFNEEQEIEACLQSLTWCDEIICVDSGSTDRTCELARRFTDKVVFNRWQGFSAQKNFAANLATGDWVLHLDADERVTPELRDEILAVVRDGGRAEAGYYMPRLNHWLGRPIYHGGWFPDYCLRLFRRGRATCIGQSHETFVVEGTTGRLRAALMHYSYWNVREHVERAVLRSAPLDARELVEGGRLCWLPPASIWSAALRQLRTGPRTANAFRHLYKLHVKNRVEFVWLLPLWPLLRFFQRYVWRQGFRDGAPGFWIAVLSAVYEAVRCAIIWEHYAAAAGKVERRATDVRIEPTYERAKSADVATVSR